MRVPFAYVVIAILVAVSITNLALTIWLANVTIQKPWSGALAANRAAFVDLHVSGKLQWDNHPLWVVANGNTTGESTTLEESTSLGESSSIATTIPPSDTLPTSGQSTVPPLFLLTGTCFFQLTYNHKNQLITQTSPLQYEMQDVLLSDGIYARILSFTSSQNTAFHADVNDTKALYADLRIVNFVPEVQTLISNGNTIVDAASMLLVDGGLLPSQINIETRFPSQIALSNVLLKPIELDPNFTIRVFDGGTLSFVAGWTTK